MLSKQHGIKMSWRTFKNRLKEFGLRRKLTLYDEIEVRRHIEQEMEDAEPVVLVRRRSTTNTLTPLLLIPTCEIYLHTLGKKYDFRSIQPHFPQKAPIIKHARKTAKRSGKIDKPRPWEC